MRAFIVSLLLTPFLFGCAGVNDRSEYQAQRLGAPVIADAEKCPDGIDAQSMPRYPEEAYRSNIEGWVVVDIELSAEGALVSRRIEAEQPNGIFGQAALDSVDNNAFKGTGKARKCKMLYTFGLNS